MAVYDPGMTVINADTLAYSQKEGKPVDEVLRSADEQRAQQRATNYLFSAFYQSMTGGAVGKDSVPIVNKHEEQGRQGLVDPSLTGQQTMLASERRMDQMKNFMAITNALPPQLYALNQYIVRTVDNSPIQMQKYLKYADSVYREPSRDFVTNRMNLEILRKRENSIYATI